MIYLRIFFVIEKCNESVLMVEKVTVIVISGDTTF